MLPTGVYDYRAAMRLPGGEQAGMRRLRYYLGESGSTSLNGQGEVLFSNEECSAAEGSPEGVRNGDTRTPQRSTSESAPDLASPPALGMERDTTRVKGQIPQQAEAVTEGGDGSAPIFTFKESRMLAGGVDNSTKLSAFMAAGCISPRMVHAAITAGRREGSEHCYWLGMHLIVRCAQSALCGLQQHQAGPVHANSYIQACTAGRAINPFRLTSN